MSNTANERAVLQTVAISYRNQGLSWKGAIVLGETRWKRLQLSTQNGWCFPLLQKGLLQPLLKELLSSPTFILHGNSSKQLLLPKKEALASSEFARPEYLHCNPAPRVTFVQPGARHLTCMSRKTTPHHFKRILTRTCHVHLQTNASLKRSSEYF